MLKSSKLCKEKSEVSKQPKLTDFHACIETLGGDISEELEKTGRLRTAEFVMLMRSSLA